MPKLRGWKLDSNTGISISLALGVAGAIFAAGGLWVRVETLSEKVKETERYATLAIDVAVMKRDIESLTRWRSRRDGQNEERPDRARRE